MRHYRLTYPATSLKEGGDWPILYGIWSPPLNPDPDNGDSMAGTIRLYNVPSEKEAAALVQEGEHLDGVWEVRRTKRLPDENWLAVWPCGVWGCCCGGDTTKHGYGTGGKCAGCGSPQVPRFCTVNLCGQCYRRANESDDLMRAVIAVAAKHAREQGEDGS